MTVKVLVPDASRLAEFADVADVTVVHYDPNDPLPADAADAEVLVTPFLGRGDPGLLAQLPQLRLIQLLTAGAEAWAPLVPPGVALSTGRGAHGGSTAEWVLATLLALRRELPTFIRAQDQGRWAYQLTETIMGSRVLIVGAGDVAAQIARRLEPCEARATLVGRTPRGDIHGMDELPELLGQHDTVVVAIPHTEETTALVDAAFLARMPDGAILVNAGRGPVVDTDALLAELTAGRLRAALDVTDPEPLPPDHPLWCAPGLIITPHVGGSVSGRLDRAYAVAVEGIKHFVAGKEPPNLLVPADR